MSLPSLSDILQAVLFFPSAAGILVAIILSYFQVYILPLHFFPDAVVTRSKRNIAKIPKTYDHVIVGGTLASHLTAFRLLAMAPQTTILLLEPPIEPRAVVYAFFSGIYLGESKTAPYFRNYPYYRECSPEIVKESQQMLILLNSVDHVMEDLKSKALEKLGEANAAVPTYHIAEHVEPSHDHDPKTHHSVFPLSFRMLRANRNINVLLGVDKVMVHKTENEKMSLELTIRDYDEHFLVDVSGNVHLPESTLSAKVDVEKKQTENNSPFRLTPITVQKESDSDEEKNTIIQEYIASAISPDDMRSAIREATHSSIKEANEETKNYEVKRLTAVLSEYSQSVLGIPSKQSPKSVSVLIYFDGSRGLKNETEDGKKPVVHLEPTAVFTFAQISPDNSKDPIFRIQSVIYNNEKMNKNSLMKWSHHTLCKIIERMNDHRKHLSAQNSTLQLYWPSHEPVDSFNLNYSTGLKNSFPYMPDATESRPSSIKYVKDTVLVKSGKIESPVPAHLELIWRLLFRFHNQPLPHRVVIHRSKSKSNTFYIKIPTMPADGDFSISFPNQESIRSKTENYNRFQGIDNLELQEDFEDDTSSDSDKDASMTAGIQLSDSNDSEFVETRSQLSASDVSSVSDGVLFYDSVSVQDPTSPVVENEHYAPVAKLGDSFKIPQEPDEESSGDDTVVEGRKRVLIRT